jgi:hypothetical protein
MEKGNKIINKSMVKTIFEGNINPFAESIGWKSLSFYVLYNISYSLRFLRHEVLWIYISLSV